MLNDKDIPRLFFAASVLIADQHTEIKKGVVFKDAQLNDCLKDKGSKTTSRSPEHFHASYTEIKPHIVRIAFGGSPPNVTRNLAGIFKTTARVNLWTSLPSGEIGENARKEFTACGVHLLKNTTGINSIGIARNLVLVPEGRDRSILKELGTEVYNEYNAAIIPAETIAGAHIILQGSMLNRSPEVFKQILKHRNPDSQMFLALPTDEKFMAERADVRELMQKMVMDGPAVVSANLDEFKACYQCKDAVLPELEKIALHWRKLPLLPGGRQRMMLITDGTNDAYLVSQKGGVQIIKPYLVEEKNRVGAGDAAFSGMIVGFMENMDPVHCAKLAMMLGALKTAQPDKQSYIIEPLRALASAELGPEAEDIVNWLFDSLSAKRRPEFVRPVMTASFNR